MTHTKLILTFLFFIFLSTNLFAQVTLEWVSLYNGTGNYEDNARSIAIDGSGNVYVTGYSMGSGTDYDYATVKYNSAGVQQWASRYNGPGNGWDGASSVAVDGLGNVYVTGYSMGIGTDYDYATVKYNSSGVQQWASRYNGPGNDWDGASSIAVDGSGNVYVTGKSKGIGTHYDIATIKYNSSGVQQWVQRYSGTGNGWDEGKELALDDSGNVYVAGFSQESGPGTDYITIKYNPSGVQQWLQKYNGPGNYGDGGYSIVLDDMGNVYVTGDCVGIGTDDDYGTIKYSQPVGIQTLSNEIPKEYKLIQNYPNPFNPITTIKFDISKSSFVKMVVYNSLGKEVTTLVNEKLSAGSYEVSWNGSDYPSGVYFYKLITDEYLNMKKMLLVK